ncbi:hypothetical protein LTR84_013092 [Exophiala bonariae]|uniref:T6SS Phospholipase effector Tle1-like catalytic domain-containing protein n=1 Tax=Exophiala bonariae TaxID=1690606 RepID=A0AAV9NDN4_9EURO|nr:hypothetical protein LTR84_013092 [Exophiala bonariae]
MADHTGPNLRVPKKRIIVCCDGTWMDSDGDYQVPSNVTRIARAIPPSGLDTNLTPPEPIHQVVCYVNGVGTGSKSLYNKYIGGATGEGLSDHIREAYSFVCLNYNDGDEIILLGFSRGAFTARSISSLISDVGLLTAKGLEFFTQVFEDWEFQQQKPPYKTKWPHLPFPGHKPPVTDSGYREEMRKRNLSRHNIKIKCVAVWDTVGGLGIPMIGLLPQPPSKDFAFVDTRVESNIEYAFQALALDEHRRAYTPTIWDWPRTETHDLKVLKQTWFPGVHSDIGGSYDDTALANLTLAWMVSLFEQYKLLTIDTDYIMNLVRPTAALLAPPTSNGTSAKRMSIPRPPTHGTTRPWGLGKIHNSMSFFFRFGGSRVRTPLEYREQELASQHGTVLWIIWKLIHRIGLAFGHSQHLRPRLARTEETIHSSVRIRMGKHGLGYDDKGTYDSQALQGWAMHGVETNPETPIALSTPGQVGEMKNVVWKKNVTAEEVQTNGRVKARVNGTNGDVETKPLVIPEEPLGAFEHEILKLWPEINEIFHTVQPGKHEKHVRKASTYPTERKSSGKRGSHGHGHGVGDERMTNGRDGLTLDTGSELRNRIETA